MNNYVKRLIKLRERIEEMRREQEQQDLAVFLVDKNEDYDYRIETERELNEFIKKAKLEGIKDFTWLAEIPDNDEEESKLPEPPFYVKIAPLVITVKEI